MRFHKNFIWGVATSSYQIEGACDLHGKGSSIWDIFTKEKGKIHNNDHGDIACDHYHKMKQDVKSMAELGVGAYRFSISWSRILPQGIGEVNMEGINFYQELITELIQNNIVPYLTIFHWDYPYELHKRGGWLNPDSSDWFAYYTSVISKYFGDRVKHYFTLNEPQVFVDCGYKLGIHAPGMRHSLRELLMISHNVMLAHGKAVVELRKGVLECKVGYAPACGPAYYPAIESEEHIKAAEKAYDDISLDNFLFSTEFWNLPILKGEYPEKWRELFGADMPFLKKEDCEIINQPLDFLGMNIYQGTAVLSDGKGGYKKASLCPGYDRTAINWPITPKCIYWAPTFIYKKYKIPIFITENGISCNDIKSLDQKVHDDNRIDYIARHLMEIKKAIHKGTDIKGYFYWSFMDNFEWANGYSERFGLVYVDFQNRSRIKKESYFWFKKIIGEEKDER